jgi:Mg2+ and Co2+ transporter CorA
MRDKWLSVDVYSEENKKRISRIIEIEWELTEAIRVGHKSHWGDQFRDKRNEMIRLRNEIIN